MALSGAVLPPFAASLMALIAFLSWRGLVLLFVSILNCSALFVRVAVNLAVSVSHEQGVSQSLLRGFMDCIQFVMSLEWQAV